MLKATGEKRCNQAKWQQLTAVATERWRFSDGNKDPDKLIGGGCRLVGCIWCISILVAERCR